MKNVEITGVGSYIPQNVKINKDFIKNQFFNEKGQPFDAPGEVIIEKFKKITGIEERRYLENDQNVSDIGTIAAQRAIDDAGIDKESIDRIIVAHNFGDIEYGTIQPDIMPSIASRIKSRLKIENPMCVAYDILFGCPGWVEGVITADAFLQSGHAKRILVIGSEALSRIVDHNDRDSMIFADGAGATLLELKDGDEKTGILGHASMTHAIEEVDYLYMGKGNKPDADPKVKYIKMLGRKIYEYALKEVPAAMKYCMDQNDIDISDIKKVFIHQANEKMDSAIITRFYRLFGQRSAPEGIMPMSIHALGNSSVATIPTLFDLVTKGKMKGHTLEKGDIVLFASVGAGMNINVVAYRY